MPKTATKVTGEEVKKKVGRPRKKPVKESRANEPVANSNTTAVIIRIFFY